MILGSSTVWCKFLVTILSCNVTNKKYLRAADTKFCIRNIISGYLQWRLVAFVNVGAAKQLLKCQTVPFIYTT